MARPASRRSDSERFFGRIFLKASGILWKAGGIYIAFLITLWLFNIAMEIGPFIDGLPINFMVIFHGYVK